MTPKDLYVIWQFRVGIETPWERAEDRVQKAFIEMFETLWEFPAQEHPLCSTCRRRLVCRKCERAARRERARHLAIEGRVIAMPAPAAAGGAR